MVRNQLLARASLATLALAALAVAQDEAANQPLQSYVGSSSTVLNPAMTQVQSTNLTSLLLQPQIQEELKVTPEQQQAIREILTLKTKASMEASRMIRQISNKRLERSANGERPSREELEESQKAYQEYRQARDLMEKNAESAVFETLEPKQSQRLLQIQLQIALKTGGLTTLAQAPLSDILTITDDQKRKLVEKQIENQKELERMMEVLREEMDHESLTEILSEAQMAKLGQMRGDRLELQRNDFYSQMLRRQVLGDDRTFGQQLLDGARKVVNDAKKELEGDQ